MFAAYDFCFLYEKCIIAASSYSFPTHGCRQSIPHNIFLHFILIHNLVILIWQGSSLGQFFSQYLEPIKLNDVTVDWKAKDLGYLTEVTFTELRPFFFIPFCMF